MTLKYIKKSETKHSDGTYKHLYQCYCGKQFLTLKRSVSAGKTRSCGCYRLSMVGKYSLGRTPANAHKDPTESSFNGLWLRYIHSARQKNLPFEITKDQFRILTKSKCHYCGSEPKSSNLQTKWARQPYIFNGLDRKNNNEGYTVNNCLPCCKDCNFLKRAWTYEAFISHIKRIAENT